MKNFENKAKIVKASNYLRSLARVGLVGWVLGGLGLCLPFVLPLCLNHSLDRFAWEPRPLYLFMGGFLFMALGFVANLHLFRFFDRLKNGHLFDAQTVGHLASAGQWAIVTWFFDIMFTLVGNSTVQTQMTFSWSGLLIGLTIIYVAWLFREAQELHEEQSLTV